MYLERVVPKFIGLREYFPVQAVATGPTHCGFVISPLELRPTIKKVWWLLHCYKPYQHSILALWESGSTYQESETLRISPGTAIDEQFGLQL